MITFDSFQHLTKQAHRPLEKVENGPPTITGALPESCPYGLPQLTVFFVCREVVSCIWYTTISIFTCHKIVTICAY